MKTLVYFDGACEPNPGGVASFGFIIREDAHGMKGRIVHSGRGIAGDGPDTTNNFAEYVALGSALRWLNETGRNGNLQILGDSQLVINQLTGSWQCNQPRLMRLRDRCLELLAGFQWKAKWISRDINVDADRLCREAWEDHTGKAFPLHPTKRRRVKGMRFKNTGRRED